MLRLEQENEGRERRGMPLRKLPSAWTERPKLSPMEHHIFNGFLRFAAFCGGEVDPTKALSWFEMTGVASEDREWVGSIYAILAPVLRESDEATGG